MQVQFFPPLFSVGLLVEPTHERWVALTGRGDQRRRGTLWLCGRAARCKATLGLVSRNSSIWDTISAPGRRVAEHLLPRPPTHLRYPAAFAGHPPETRPGASGARNHSHDSGYLLSLPAEHGRPDREGYGSSSHLEHLRCCTVAAQRAPELPEPFLVSRALPAKQRFFRVGDAGFESATSSL
jgi:hypothetical protein